jgi:hypothetical protein
MRERKEEIQREEGRNGRGNRHAWEGKYIEREGTKGKQKQRHFQAKNLRQHSFVNTRAYLVPY